MDEKQTSFTTPIVVVILLALLVAAYVGAYVATVERVPLLTLNSSAEPVTAGVVPHYRGMHSKFTADFFWPIHWLDLQVRSSYWDGAV